MSYRSRQKRALSNVDPAEQVRDDIGTLREKLFDVAKKNAAKLPGNVVIQVLKDISEDMYEAGIDEALRHTEKEITDWDNIASGWDLTWLALFTRRLYEVAQKNG